MDDWLLWQLIDSALPVGGLPHSAGLEATWQRGELDDAGVDGFLTTLAKQHVTSALPLTVACWRGAYRMDLLASVDAQCDAMLSNHVSNRASRSQGRSLCVVVDRVFGSKVAALLTKEIASGTLAGHQAPALGAVCRDLGVGLDQTARASTHIAIRAAVSAAVRLGAVGPLEAQRVQRRITAAAEQAIDVAKPWPMDSIAQTAPLLDLLQGTQDQLYTRLFRS